MGFKLSDLLGPGGATIGRATDASEKLLGKNVTQTQVPLETEEERRARQLRLKFAETGRIGDVTAGEDLGLEFGVFEPTDIEKTALDRVRALLASDQPEELDAASSALMSILAASESRAEEQFEPFKTRTLREIQEAEERLKRGSAFTGSLFGTQTIRGLGDVQARGQEVLAERLSALVNEERNRQLQSKLQAAPILADIGRTRESIELGRIGTGQRLGSLERLLESARLDAETQETLRRRGEVFSRLDVASGITSPEFGIPSVTTRVPSPFENLLNIAASVGGRIAAAKAGGAVA